MLIRGMCLTTPLCVLCSVAESQCSVVDGDFHIGVRPALPLDLVDMIMGNNMAGNRV